MKKAGKTGGKGWKTVRLINRSLDIAILIVVLFFVAADLYAAWDSRQAYEWAKPVHYEIYKPTAETESHSFEELREINPEVFGWLTVYGTNIDYPIVQGDDNQKYVNTNALGQYSLSGAIFLDARCSIDFTDFPSIFYGHHMEKQAMFGEIGQFSEVEFFDVHQYGMLYYDEQEHGLEFFAFVQCDAYDGEVFRTRIAEPEEREAYLEFFAELALHTRDVQVTADDRIVLLSTCSNSTTNSRDILAGKVTDEVYEDTFITADTRNPLMVDGLAGLWALLPLWGALMSIILPVTLSALLISWLFTLISKKRGTKRRL